MVVLLGLGGAGGFAYVRYVAKTEDRARLEAEATYEAGNFGTAEQQFESLAATYPNSRYADQYRFFADLSGVRAAVGSVSARSEPGPPLDRLRAFVGEFGDSLFAQPGGGYGSDIVAAGRQMADALAAHAGDRLKDARAEARRLDDDWPSHLARHRTDPAAADLAAAERAVADGEALLPTLDRFREKDGPNFGDQKAKFDTLKAEIAAEHARTAAVAGWRDLPGDPTDLKIESFTRSMRAAGLADDPEVARLTAWAEAELRARIVGTAGFRPAGPPPVDVSPAVLVSAPVAGSPSPLAASDKPPDVVFAVARGVLYALDAHDGTRLWGRPVADATADPRGTDLPVRFTLADGRTDWAIVPETLAGRSGLTARNARTGEPVWHQPLEAGLAGRPLILGRRIYVPLADEVGTVVEIQATTGDRLGRLTIRQRIGASLVGADGPTPGTVPPVRPGRRPPGVRVPRRGRGRRRDARTAPAHPGHPDRPPAGRPDRDRPARRPGGRRVAPIPADDPGRRPGRDDRPRRTPWTGATPRRRPTCPCPGGRRSRRRPTANGWSWRPTRGRMRSSA